MSRADSDLHEVFNDSFLRCQSDPEFIDRFYLNFISSSEEIKKAFLGVDLERQKGMLLRSIPIVTVSHHNAEIINRYAQKHLELGIKPEMYSYWMDSMIEAVRMTDKFFNDRVEVAWREIMKPGIDQMKKRASL